MILAVVPLATIKINIRTGQKDRKVNLRGLKTGSTRKNTVTFKMILLFFF